MTLAQRRILESLDDLLRAAKGLLDDMDSDDRAEAKSQTEWAVERAEEALHSLASIERAKGESGWLVKDYGRDAEVSDG